MLNRTFTSLALSGITARFFEIPMTSKSSFSSFTKFKISKSFSTFISQNYSPNSKLFLRKSSFTKFLDTALSIQQVPDINNEMQTEHKTILGQNGDVLIMDSSFSHCITQDYHGGALFFDAKTLSIKIDRVFFLKCYTSGSGGAFYATPETMSLTRACFDECHALESGHAFYIDLDSKESQANFSEVTILRSSISDTFGGKGAGVFLSGNYLTQLVNCSENHALSIAANYASLGTNSFQVLFSEFRNSTSLNIFKFLDLQESLFVTHSNFISNTASHSLFHTSSKNVFARSNFVQNDITNLISGKDIEEVQLSDCLMDVSYSLDTINSLKTNNIETKKDIDLILVKFAFAGKCRIVGDKEQIESKDNIVKEILRDLPLSKEYEEEYGKYVSYVPQYPTPRGGEPTEEPEEPIQISRVRSRGPHGRRSSQQIIADDIPNHSSHTRKPKSSGRAHISGQTPARIHKGEKTSKGKQSAMPVFTPSASFSPSETFYKSRTFLPSLQFTASISISGSLVPYVLYSGAGFVVFAVLTSFLFLKSSDAGYNLMTPSESADSRISDYASSTSTTVTITGESSSVVV